MEQGVNNMDKVFDYKKEYKNLYLPSKKPELTNIPTMNFIMIDGNGDPNSERFKQAVATLYAISYTIRMSVKKGIKINGYFNYVVPPLEGLWWVEDNNFSLNDKSNWVWTLMIRQPDFVSNDVFNWALEESKKAKPNIDFSKVRLEEFTEGLCVQIMHIGPYANEPDTMSKVSDYLLNNNLKDLVGLGKKHHELYLSDPRKTASDKIKTVLRHPVEENKK
jgi:hypothetical protein